MIVLPETRRFQLIEHVLGTALLNAPQVEVGHWQALDVRDKPQGQTRELRGVVFEYDIPGAVEALDKDIQPNQPFADNQFRDRVSGQPLNPPPSAKDWPWAQREHEDHVDAWGVFSHSYPERLWPRWAGEDYNQVLKARTADEGIRGVRYRYGDLIDVVTLLVREPYTRQAYVPLFFPEDTGAHHRERIPCTLGYHFILRDNQLHCTYFSRSVDFVRYLRDDTYMACRLCSWMLWKVQEVAGISVAADAWVGVTPGTLTFHIVSLHAFEGDLPSLRRKYAPLKG